VASAPLLIKSQREHEFGLYAVCSLWAGRTSKEIHLTKPKSTFPSSQNLIKLFRYGYLQKLPQNWAEAFLSLKVCMKLIFIFPGCNFTGLVFFLFSLYLAIFITITFETEQAG